MRILRRLQNALRPALRPQSSTALKRTYASPSPSQNQNGARKPLPIPASPMNEPPADPRPPWLFSTAAFLRIVLVPTGFIYAIFFHDFGEEDHVFMPPRRWLKRQKESFFALTPAEKGLVSDAEVVDRKQSS